MVRSTHRQTALTARRTARQRPDRTDKRLCEYLRGWQSYFGRADPCYLFEDLDSWIRDYAAPDLGPAGGDGPLRQVK